MNKGKGKILIADDMETFLRLEKMLLERTGYDIVMAKSGSEAIKKIQAEKPDLIFLDLLMPDMNGDVVCRFVKTNKGLKHLPVIMVTTKGDVDSRDRCTQAGCDDFITKPVTQRDLFEKIKQYIKVERRRHPRASLRVTVATTGESQSFTSFTYDVSQGGIFVETSSPVPPGTELELEFKLPNEKNPIHAKGRAVRVLDSGQTPSGRKTGMGIQFTQISAVDTKKIQEFVNENRE